MLGLENVATALLDAPGVALEAELTPYRRRKTRFLLLWFEPSRNRRSGKTEISIFCAAEAPGTGRRPGDGDVRGK